ncbi:cyclic nucleotide-binding domain-containing protein [Fervidobacterium islandicum]|uniref:Cyclic nucleotide-binding domain-containing protein n=1 Tax=Fervidobacterium islandicum TaxID=2423 RepID=A0AAI8CLL4_FERIS|nr:cyclic nucleotide-binding domain-containing protein [Fervidobacterium islandicum]AMW33194.1 cyclic nucleotide-binding domain-containing protein [Fervidobacterium islandicum]
METLEFKDGDKIIEKDKKEPYVYIVKSGKVKVSLGAYETILSEELPDVFGLEALVDEPYTETCIAVGDVKVIRCEKNEFKDIYVKTEVGKEALKSFMRRTAKALGWL